ncbi:MAG: MurR/RpiR family transcriptional regulator, partial [Planctomycetota bacterium]|nr:MurR/RpiR family transcriptional regulator [Planctomycetota bacterium]
MTIKNLIATANTRLTPTERRIAEAVISDPTLLTFGTVSRLAEKVGTSPPSIVRFATKLGFEGFSELQQHAQSEFSEQVISPSQRVRQDHEGETQQKIERAMHHAFDELNSESLANMATPIVSAPQVFILSGETSMAGAYVLQSGLSMIRDNVMLIEEHATGRALCGAQQGDVAVVFDFSRYRRNSILASQTLGEHGVTIVAVTDSPLS